MESGIADFYNNKTIFVTGGSGFLGKVIIEKLLRCCPGVKKILMLLRSKKGRTAEDRIKTLFNVELFNPLRNKYPNFEEKVQAIAGDMMHEGLGLSEDDKQFLQENVDIVIHSAATVKFDEKLRIALQMNVVGVKEIVKLCKGIKNLEILCHVSTAYSNCDKEELIQEKIYPVITDPNKIIETAKWMTDEMLTALTPSLLGNYPNTYTFTKGLAEQIVLRETDGIPTIIFRPSIICGAYAEPYPGWVDNYNGLTGMMAAAGKGMLRTMYSSKDSVADVIPVDYVANSVIVATCYSALHKSKDITVYNCTSGNVNPLTWGFLADYTVSVVFKKYPFDEIFRRPNFSFASNKLAFYYWTYVSHRIPAVAADTLAILIGAKPRVCKLYERIDKAVHTVKFFTSKEWMWSPDNFLMLQSAVSGEEKEIFEFDMTTIDWKKYIETMVFGVKKYLIKDNMEELDKARWQIKRYRFVRWTSCTLFFILAWRILISRSLRFRQLWFKVVFAVYRALRYLNLVSIS